MVAYREFNGAANELALQKSYEWADDVKQGHEVFANDARMNAAATLRGLIDHGTAEGLKTIGLQDQQMTDLKKSVYNEAVSALSAAGGPYGKESASLEVRSRTAFLAMGPIFLET